MTFAEIVSKYHPEVPFWLMSHQYDKCACSFCTNERRNRYERERMEFTNDIWSLLNWQRKEIANYVRHKWDPATDSVYKLAFEIEHFNPDKSKVSTNP